MDTPTQEQRRHSAWFNSAQTRGLKAWDGCGGYHDTDSIIYGFSHTHLQGTGVSDYGDILMMPCTQFDPVTFGETNTKAPSTNSLNADTQAFTVFFFSDHGIQAELTTTPRVGVHRYTLEDPDTLTLVVDLDHRARFGPLQHGAPEERHVGRPQGQQQLGRRATRLLRHEI